jgi:hypothetical protein
LAYEIEMTDIREIMENMAKTDQPNFRPITFVDDRGRTYPAFTMNRDGFFAIAGHRNKPGALQVLGAAGAGPSYPTASVSPRLATPEARGFFCASPVRRDGLSLQPANGRPSGRTPLRIEVRAFLLGRCAGI